MIRKELEKYIERKDALLVPTMEKLDQYGRGILFIVDEDDKLIGTLTDGDVRRWLIHSGTLQVDVDTVMRKNPRFLYQNYESQNINVNRFMIEQKINAVPVLNDKEEIVDVIFRFYEGAPCINMHKKELADTPVVIMAGGKGTRLYPYTKILPKPLIPIGDIPIIERIMDRFWEYGVQRFFLTVNYKKEMLKAYFSEAKIPYTIEYVNENIPLGTAGSIRLIQEHMEKPVIVTNCDTLIKADYNEILNHHVESANEMTIISSLKNTSIPYGVLHTKEQGIITSIEEKPQLSYFINTGMYIVNPEFLEWIPENRVFHMTDLAGAMIEKGRQVGIYPISENSFLDMGEFEEMKRMEERINGGTFD